MKTVRVTTTLYDEILEKIDLYARLNYEDRSTALRQLVTEGLNEKLREAVVAAYRRGDLSVREAADALGVKYLEMQEILDRAGVAVLREIPSRPHVPKGKQAAQRGG